jgi:hypothetical protein
MTTRGQIFDDPLGSSGLLQLLPLRFFAVIGDHMMPIIYLKALVATAST